VLEWIWPTPSSCFNHSIMTEDPKYSFEGQRDKKIMVPLVPGLYSYNSNKKLVDYRSFLTDSDERSVDIPTLVCKSWVVTC